MQHARLMCKVSAVSNTHKGVSKTRPLCDVYPCIRRKTRAGIFLKTNKKRVSLHARERIRKGDRATFFERSFISVRLERNFLRILEDVLYVLYPLHTRCSIEINFLDRVNDSRGERLQGDRDSSFSRRDVARPFYRSSPQKHCTSARDYIYPLARILGQIFNVGTTESVDVDWLVSCFFNDSGLYTQKNIILQMRKASTL